MTMLAILGIAIGVVLVAAIAYTRRSHKNQEPLHLGVGRKLRP
jgi:ABC-type antimicrobial peptide transport system permease subunit